MRFHPTVQRRLDGSVFSRLSCSFAFSYKQDKQDDSQKTISFSNNAMNARTHMHYQSLSKSKADRHMEPFIIDIEATDETNYEVSSHEGEEFIHVMEGAVEITYGKKSHVIEAGDSIYYDSIVPHHVHGYEGQAAKILAVVYTPI